MRVDYRSAPTISARRGPTGDLFLAKSYVGTCYGGVNGSDWKLTAAGQCEYVVPSGKTLVLLGAAAVDSCFMVGSSGIGGFVIGPSEPVGVGFNGIIGGFRPFPIKSGAKLTVWTPGNCRLLGYLADASKVRGGTPFIAQNNYGGCLGGIESGDWVASPRGICEHTVPAGKMLVLTGASPAGVCFLMGASGNVSGFPLGAATSASITDLPLKAGTKVRIWASTPSGGGCNILGYMLP